MNSWVCEINYINYYVIYFTIKEMASISGRQRRSHYYENMKHSRLSLDGGKIL